MLWKPGQRSVWFAGVWACLLWLTGPAWAQDDFDERLPPLDAAEMASAEGQMLAQGLQYSASENPMEASVLFYRVFAESDASDALRFRAEYELGKAMFQMGLFYGSLYYFDGIVSFGPDHPMFIAAYPWLLRLQRRLPGENHMLERLAHYADFFPDQIEPKYRDQLAYLIGRHHYLRGQLDEARDFLQYVTRESRYFLQARFLEGVALIQQYRGQQAVDAFRDVVFGVLAADERTDDMRHLAELAVLSVARTFYSTGEYDKAIRWYDQVPASSPYWLDALFEKSWALFQQTEYNRALGNLHSLNSPFFDDEFYPEGRILEAVIFFRNCNYPAVRESVEEFQAAYVPFLDQLDDMLLDLGTDEEFYDLITSLEAQQERDFSPQLQQLINAAVDNQTVAYAIELVTELDRELRVINAADAAWRETSLGDEILSETGLARSVAAGSAGEELSIRISRARDNLLSLVNQAEAILVETDLIEHAGGLSAQLRDEMNLSDAGLLPPPSDAEHLLWHFAGEYWRDELGYYWYAIRSRCDEVGL